MSKKKVVECVYQHFTVLILMVLIICFALLLSSLVSLTCFEVVRRNIDGDVEAIAYFYTELGDFAKYEKGTADDMISDSSDFE